MERLPFCVTHGLYMLFFCRRCYYKNILDRIPSLVFLADDDVRIYGYNKAASELFRKEAEKALRMGG
jgi:hypothetical protein